MMSTMPHLPRRHSLIDETAEVLRHRLDAGEWTVRLPGEMELAAALQVGRNTVRSALAILEGEGRLLKRNGSRCEIVACGRRLPTRRHAVLLMAKPEGVFPPVTSQWIAATRLRLESEGWTMQIRVEPEVYRSDPAGRLEALVAAAPGAVWMLHRSTPTMQRWFQERGVRTVLAGSRHEGIALPQVEIDLGAVSRHAAGRFLSRGHRRLAILRPENPFAGDAESVEAFRRGVGAAEVVEVRTHTGAADVATAVRGLMRSPQPPTALYVLHADHCVTVLTSLLRMGVPVPERLSLICREDAPYLALLCPEPARYRHSPRLFASRLAAQVVRCGDRSGGGRPSSRIMPSTVEGETLAAAPVL